MLSMYQQRMNESIFPSSFFLMHASIDSLPLDTLVQVLCKLDHVELKQLLLVSKSFHNAVLAARQLHFDFSTPSPTMRIAFSNGAVDQSPRSTLPKLECRKPPRKPKLSEEETRRIAVVLFPAGERTKGLVPEPRWRRIA